AAVVLFADPQIAGSRALPDACQETRPEPPPAFVGFFDVQGTGAEPKDALQHADRSAQPLRAGEWPVQLHAARARFSSELDAREFFARRDLQIREGLVVLEFRVEPRADVLDQPRFEQQG